MKKIFTILSLVILLIFTSSCVSPRLENYFNGWYIEEEIGLTKPDGWSCIVDDLKDIARHFYELGKNSK